jgi:hypothetical protein
MSTEMTAVKVSEANWTIINAAKRPGESMDDALTRLLDDVETEVFVDSDATER